MWRNFDFVLISFIHMYDVVVVSVCLRFQDVQIKQVDRQMNTKIVNNYK